MQGSDSVFCGDAFMLQDATYTHGDRHLGKV